MLKRFRSNSSGSALVELALTAPLLMVLIVAGAELGRIAYAAIEVQSAARAGADYGAQNPGTAFGPTSAIKQAAKDDVPNITDLTFPSDPSTACVCETIVTSTTSTDTVTYNPYGATTAIPAPISCYDSKGNLNADFTQANCDTVSSTGTVQVVEYVQVATQAVIHTMFHYPGIPTTFTLHGLSQVRVLQN